MALKFKKGDAVAQVVKPITGVITDLKIIDDDVQFEVTYTGEDGEQHARFFTEAQIEAGAAPETPAP